MISQPSLMARRLGTSLDTFWNVWPAIDLPYLYRSWSKIHILDDTTNNTMCGDIAERDRAQIAHSTYVCITLYKIYPETSNKYLSYTHRHVHTHTYIYTYVCIPTLNFNIKLSLYHLYIYIIIEGSLEVKLATIWTHEKQRWEKRREEERRSKKRNSEERRFRHAKR